uniref:Uncharacterized protein n=1 Tax=Oryza sativa subsp. japonica TaxID=39947 RepID=Q75HK1_ORYSJ|nr:hypothetical protein [Oryza sativa Japonica Group]
MEMAAPGRGDDLEELITRLVDVTVVALMIWRRCSTTAARRSPRAAWRGQAFRLVRFASWCNATWDEDRVNTVTSAPH